MKKILFLADKRGGAFDITARNLVTFLRDEYDTTIMFIDDEPFIDENEYDLIYVFWWGERWHRKYLRDYSKVIKEISSLRWADQNEFGHLSPSEMKERYLNDAKLIVTTSLELQSYFPESYYYFLGVDQNKFKIKTEMNSELIFGWAGNPDDELKNFKFIKKLSEKTKIEIADGKIDHDDMPEFFNKIDVIIITSISEGTPLPLIEAMACGCFPITTNVGVVPEIVKHKENGIIIDKTYESLFEAVTWCYLNVDRIEKTRKINQDLIHNNRTWMLSAKLFKIILSDYFKSTVNFAKSFNVNSLDKYGDHFKRINGAGFDINNAKYFNLQFDEDLKSFLPSNKNHAILEIGSGFGYLLNYLLSKGYKRVSAIDISPYLISEVRINFGHKLEWVEESNALQYLKRYKNYYDSIIAFDMLEHLDCQEAEHFVTDSFKALKNDGTLILRVPNMANILGGYSMYMDSTHKKGYTEWTLIELIKSAGFKSFEINKLRPISLKRKCFNFINNVIHKFLYHINDRKKPTTYSKNIVLKAMK